MPTIDPAQNVKRLICAVDIVQTGEKLYDAEAVLQDYLDGLPFEAGEWLVAHKENVEGDPRIAKWLAVVKRAHQIVRPLVPDDSPLPLIRIGRPIGRPKKPPVQVSPDKEKERKEVARARAKASREARLARGDAQVNLYLSSEAKAKATRVAKKRGMAGLNELVESLISAIDEGAA